MEKKTSSAVMQHLIYTLQRTSPRLDITTFTDTQILEQPIEQWPVVNVLIAFYSKGFPVDKALNYVQLRNPFLVNDLYMQKCLLDRRNVRDVLEKAGVGVLRNVVVDRSNGDYVVQSENGQGDCLYVYRGGESGKGLRRARKGGECVERIYKPFVEKPVRAEDHNVFVYFKGGGVRKLFSKTRKRSSIFDRERRKVRSGGNYVYEPYLEPRGRRDVKAYGVGGEWFYAETRKAPTVDGIVERGANGMERRDRTELTEREIKTCEKVAKAFRFFTIGFDLLRVGNHTFVIDVNGWTLSKTSKEFATVCGKRLSSHILANVG